MRREDQDARHSIIIETTCMRQQHVICVTWKGRVRFESHGNISPEALINEGGVRACAHKGCYLFAAILMGKVMGPLSTRVAYDFVQHRSRRTSALAALHNGGINDTQAGKFFHVSLNRAALRRTSRNYTDEYPHPFHKMPYQRVHRVYSRIRSDQDKKLARVMKGLNERGFAPLESWQLPSYHR